jgi:hypothetical protein
VLGVRPSLALADFKVEPRFWPVVWLRRDASVALCEDFLDESNTDPEFGRARLSRRDLAETDPGTVEEFTGKVSCFFIDGVTPSSCLAGRLRFKEAKGGKVSDWTDSCGRAGVPCVDSGWVRCDKKSEKLPDSPAAGSALVNRCLWEGSLSVESRWSADRLELVDDRGFPWENGEDDHGSEGWPEK